MIIDMIKHSEPYQWAYGHVYYPSVIAVGNIFSNKIFFVAFAAILFLEKLFPAKPQQKIFSKALAQDTVWLFLEACFGATIIVAYTHFLSSIYKQHLNFLTITPIQQLPVAVSFTIGVLASDFLAWFHHWVRHRVPWFWEFHTIHHSQKELNMFTDLRYHVLEYMVSRTISTFPLLMVGVNTYGVLLFALIHTWHTHLYHANIKSNFGPLRYIFVTPQSHRIHHSIEPRHQDKNFGVMFSIWDRMFGTHYHGENEYPDTGIADHHFPFEKSIKGLDLILNPVRQHIYPFISIARSLFKK